jgi:hypothetical protein
MGGFQAKRKHEVGKAYIWPKPALRGRPRPPGRPLASPQASWVVWWRVRRRAWPGAASRYRPREKVPKNTFLENPILTWPSYSHLGQHATILSRVEKRGRARRRHPEKPGRHANLEFRSVARLSHAAQPKRQLRGRMRCRLPQAGLKSASGIHRRLLPHMHARATRTTGTVDGNGRRWRASAASALLRCGPAKAHGVRRAIGSGQRRGFLQWYGRRQVCYVGRGARVSGRSS